jgi:hypothetical protein
MPRPPGRSALAFARRIEALSRVIGNPEPAIRRLIRFFARLPHGLIDPAGFGVRFTGNWRHCGPEYRRAPMHSERLFTVFNIVTEPG